MEINRNNYEACFIDYLEGNLDEQLVDQFIEFLQQNPDLKEELALFENITIEPENISFNKKVTLLKEKYDAEKELNKAAVDDLEGEITEADKIKFNSYLASHPEKRKDVELFAKTKLHADESIVFAKKKKLYHFSLGRTVLFWSGRVAAVLVLLLAFYALIERSSNEIVPDNQLANFEDKKEKKVSTTVDINKVIAEPKQKEKDEIKKPAIKRPVKKATPENKPRSSLRENTKGRVIHEDLVQNRMPVKVPAELNSITASLYIKQPQVTLAKMNKVEYGSQKNYKDEKLIADVVKEKTGINNFKFSKITKAGLNLVSGFTKNNFTYQTDTQGKVTEYNYDSRLLAFSIPAGGDNIGY